MNSKSFIVGTLLGIIIGAASLYLILPIGDKQSDVKLPYGVTIDYLAEPVSYEGKSQTSFEVTSVLEGAAMATEKYNYELDIKGGNRVIILGEDFYDGQIIHLKNPQRIGTYKRKKLFDKTKSRPVIEGQQMDEIVASDLLDDYHQLVRLEKPVRYENKSRTRFKVSKVLSKGAFAREVSNLESDSYYGKKVFILGENYYDDQIIKVENPMRIGTCKSTSETVPVINGKISYK